MQNFCRTCLRVPKKSLNLFDNLGLVRKIESISSIQLIMDSHWPSLICDECVNNIYVFHNFKKVIINTDKDIKERMEFFNIRSATMDDKTGERHKEHDIALVSAPYLRGHGEIVFSEEGSEGDGGRDACKMISKALEEPDTKCDMDLQKKLDNFAKWECKNCGKVFNSRFKLYNHKKSEHIARGVCSICGLVVRADHLKKHLRLHSEKPIECRTCGKMFKNSESLRCHLFLHRGYLYTCEFCGKIFKVKSEHSRHLKIHTDPDARKVQCSICGKKVHEIKKHMLTHTGERPFLCLYCSKGFTSAYALKVHTRQHTNERPYKCKFCCDGFSQKVSLTAHLKSKHSTE